MKSTKVALAAIAVATTLAASALTGTAPAEAQGVPSLTVSPTTLSGDGSTTITVTGRNYLVPPHAPGTSVFGGVYLLFGWVSGGQWGPSNRNSNNNNGTFGSSYAYSGDGGDGGTREDGSGATSLIAFTPGSESGTATSQHMDAAGNWSTTLVIPGPVFTATVPATGQVRTFDCRQVQCGVLTIGAHGKPSATNEVFAPVTFTQPASPRPQPTVPPQPDPQQPAPTWPTKQDDLTPPTTVDSNSTTVAPEPGDDASASHPSNDTTKDPASDTTSTTPGEDGIDGEEPDDSPSTMTISQRDTSGGGGGAGFLLAGGAGLAVLGSAAFFGLRRRAASGGAGSLTPSDIDL